MSLFAIKAKWNSRRCDFIVGPRFLGFAPSDDRTSLLVGSKLIQEVRQSLPFEDDRVGAAPLGFDDH